MAGLLHTVKTHVIRRAPPRTEINLEIRKSGGRCRRRGRVEHEFQFARRAGEGAVREVGD